MKHRFARLVLGLFALTCLIAAGCGRGQSPAATPPPPAAPAASPTTPATGSSPANAPWTSAAPTAPSPMAASPTSPSGASASPAGGGSPVSSAAPAAPGAHSLTLDNFRLSDTKQGPARTDFKTGDAVFANFDVRGAGVQNGNIALELFLRVESPQGRVIRDWKSQGVVAKPWPADRPFPAYPCINTAVKPGTFKVSIRVLDRLNGAEAIRTEEVRVR